MPPRVSTKLQPPRLDGFTLVELLVVVGIIAVLIAILLPALSAARETSRATVCASNLRQLMTACYEYMDENESYWPPAHYDYYPNLSRWHGTRPTQSDAFNFAYSPLLPYLQVTGVKTCPSFEFNQGIGFERSCGGYGYNDGYIGSSISVPVIGDQPWGGPNGPDNVAAKQTDIQRPAEKVAFTDAAYASSGPVIFEYSFCEPPLNSWGSADPSIHFRHRGKANVAWVDGHVSSERMEWTNPGLNNSNADNAQMNLGWFGPKDNSLFQRD